MAVSERERWMMQGMRREDGCGVVRRGGWSEEGKIRRQQSTKREGLSGKTDDAKGGQRK